MQRGRFVVNQKSYSRLKIENLQSNVTEHYRNTLMLMFEVAVAGRLHPVLRVSGSCFQGWHVNFLTGLEVCLLFKILMSLK